MGRSIQRIIGGSDSTSAQDAVVVLAHFDGGLRRSLCTATLVAPNLVVTARHCVTSTDASAMCATDGSAVIGAQIHADYDATTMAVFVGTAGAAAASNDETKASAHGATLVVDDATTLCNHDFAFLVLDQSLSAPTVPVRMTPPAASEAVTAVGWGITGDGYLPDTRQQRTQLTVSGAGPLAFPDDKRYGVGASEFLLGESACSGDSGSPVLSASGALLGVASRAGNGQARDPNNIANVCTGTTVHAVYTHLANAQDLVTRAFLAAGATPVMDGADSAPSASSDPPSTSPPPPTAQEAQATMPATVASAPTEDAGDAGGGSCSASPRRTTDDAGALLALVGLAVLRRRSAKRGVASARRRAR